MFSLKNWHTLQDGESYRDKTKPEMTFKVQTQYEFKELLMDKIVQEHDRLNKKTVLQNKQGMLKKMMGKRKRFSDLIQEIYRDLDKKSKVIRFENSRKQGMPKIHVHRVASEDKTREKASEGNGEFSQKKQEDEKFIEVNKRRYRVKNLFYQ
jgi:hypothetical protein